MSALILAVDDDPGVLETVSESLRWEGFAVDAVTDGETALAASRRGRHDLIVLDWMLPDLPGIEVCRLVRSESTVPIIMLTARASEVDCVRCLEIGADDFVAKPFSSAELAARVRAVLRRRDLDRRERESAPRRIGGIVLDYERHQVVVDGASVPLTVSGFRILTDLAAHLGRPLTREQIMEHLWERPFFGNPRTCDGHVAALRQKIERDPDHPERLLTVRGVGYKLVEA